MSQSIQRLTVAVACAVVPAFAQDKKPVTQPNKQMGWTGVLDEKEFASLHQLTDKKPPQLRGKMIEVSGAAAYLSMPKGDKPSAAVVVIHEWWGLNDHIKHWADRLAADGYAALAIDLYDGVVATTREKALATMQSVDGDKALKTLQAAHAYLAGPNVGARRRACIGWCFGGGWSLRLAMAAPDLDAAVVYYGRLVTDPEQLAGIRAPVLGIFGNKDRGIPPASVDAFEAAMKKAKKRLRVLRYDANHAFANPSGAAYDQKNAEAAWKEVRSFLDYHLASDARRGTFVAAEDKVSFVIPRGWKYAEKRPMRTVNLATPEGVECYVTVLGGFAGGVSANINRWYAQMGQEALSDDEIHRLPRLEMIGEKAPFVSVEGTFMGMRGEPVENSRMLAVVCSLDGATVFVKMIGKGDIVAKHEALFRAFCSSMRK